MGATTTGKLKGRIAMVSGASRGIGREIALGLSLEGARVVGVARTESSLDEVGDEVRAQGGQFLSVPADLSDVATIRTTVDSGWEWQGSIDVLVNAAGMMVRSSPLETDPATWDEVFALNTRAAFFLSQAVGGRMLEGDGGTMVNVTSVAGEVTTGASVAYSASKAALIHMTRVLAVNWAPKVRVNAVGPAYIRSSLNENWLAQADNRKFVLDRTPLNRVGEPRDVVGAVVFLACKDSAYVTGHHLLVDGGWTAQ
jgi:NAD(P)-dependent dehydrogenase (short-subunit alcohol dehydrogenase family)